MTYPFLVSSFSLVVSRWGCMEGSFIQISKAELIVSCLFGRFSLSLHGRFIQIATPN